MRLSLVLILLGLVGYLPALAATPASAAPSAAASRASAALLSPSARAAAPSPAGAPPAASVAPRSRPAPVPPRGRAVPLAPRSRAAVAPRQRSAAVPRRRAAAIRRFDLPALERLARVDAPSLSVARAKLRAAESQILKAQLLWLPKANFQATYSIVPRYRCQVPEVFDQVRLDNGRTLYQELNTREMREQFCFGTDKSDTATDLFRNFDPRNYFFRFEINLGQPIYTFGKIRFAKRLARAGVALARARVRQARQQLLRDVRRAYFGLKLAREMLFTIEEGMPHLRKAERLLRKRLEADDEDADRVDLYRLRIARADVDELVLQVKRGERMALDALRALLGSRLGKAFDLDPRPLAPVVARLGALATYLRLARSRRPEWKMVDLAVRAARANVKLRTVQFLPDLLLLMRYRLTLSTSEDDPRSAYLNDQLHGNSFYVGLALRWDLDFHFKYAALARARADLEAARSARVQARLGLALQVRQAWSVARAAEQRMRILARARKAARRWMIAMSLRYQAGGVKPKELIDALKAFFQAQIRHHQAVHDFNLAVADLSRAVGVDLVQRRSSRGLPAGPNRPARWDTAPKGPKARLAAAPAPARRAPEAR